MVAFETERLLRNEHRTLCDGPDISPHVDQHWFDPARDANKRLILLNKPGIFNSLYDLG